MTYTTEELRQTGIYAIINKVNGKRYIGSTKRSFADRWSKHKSALKRQTHHSLYLQSSVNKYGIVNFEFRILETIRKELLDEWTLQREQWWLDLFGSYNRELGYNHCPIAGDCTNKQESEWRLNKKKQLEITNPLYAFRNPQGEKVTCFNLTQFCKNNNLSVSCMCNIHKGTKKSHRGYTRYIENQEWQKPEIKAYIFVDPDGNKIETTNVRKFCRENNLNQGNMYSVQRGEVYQCLGWRKYNSDQDLVKFDGKIFTFKDKQGNIISGNNLTELCKKHNLKRHSMYHVHYGNRKSNHGWYKAND